MKAPSLANDTEITKSSGQNCRIVLKEHQLDMHNFLFNRNKATCTSLTLKFHLFTTRIIDST